MTRYKYFFNSAFLALLLFVGMFCSSAFSTTLIVDHNGQLSGASDVVVNGEYFDVKFFPLNTEFSGMYGDWWSLYRTLPFKSVYDAIDASEALMEFVFLDNEQGNFDTNPGLLVGMPSEATIAYILTPYGTRYDRDDGNFYLQVFEQYNAVDEFLDDLFGLPEVDIWGGQIFDITIFNSKSVWAQWNATDPPSSVPVPGTILLLGLGLMGLVGLRKKLTKLNCTMRRPTYNS